MITDHDLIRAAYPGTRAPHHYRAVYLNGDTVVFAVDTFTVARRYAREYGVRFKNGVRVAGMERLD